MKVLVLGAGFAGVAAAFAARRAGVSVTIVHSTPGASSLYAGVVDGRLAPRDSTETSLLAELAKALGLQLSPQTVVATREGVVRPAAGSDAALLDLAPLAGKLVGVVDVPRDDWDAPLLVRSFAASDWAQATGTRFELVPLELLEKGYQRRVSPFDFAVSFERAERPAWLIELLKANAGPAAWLFGPWLGLKRPLALELTKALGVAVGEVTSPPGGVAGARFESRRDALLRSLEAEVLTQRVTEVRTSASGISLLLEGGTTVSGDALVLASGGFVSGALELSGSLSGAEPGGCQLAIAGLPAAQVRGEVGRPVSSLFGVDLAARGLSLLERVGVAVSAEGRVSGAPRVLASGDVTAPEPPSVAHALLSGLRAGTAGAGIARGGPLE